MREAEKVIHRGNGHVKTKAEIGMMHHKPRNGEAKRGHNEISPRASGGSVTLPPCWYCISYLKNSTGKNFYCFKLKPPILILYNCGQKD